MIYEKNIDVVWLEVIFVYDYDYILCVYIQFIKLFYFVVILN